MELTHRPLGTSGIMVAPISLGTVKFGRNTDVRYPARFELPSDAAVTSLLETAREAGINLIDTAPAYGDSESRLGRLLPGPRENWVICTKAGEIYDEGSSRFDFSAAGLGQSIDNSLRRLGTDYLDIVLIHSDGNDLRIINESHAFDVLRARKEKGDIRLIGMSTKSPAGTAAALEHADVVMVTLNLDDQSHLAIIDEANRRGRGVLIKKALMSGHGDARQSLSFVLSHSTVDSVVVGTINPAHLLDNVAVALETGF